MTRRALLVALAVVAAAAIAGTARAGPDYRASLATLCVAGGTKVDATATTSYAVRIARAATVLRPLRTGVKALTPPADLAPAHAQLLRGLGSLLDVTASLGGKLAAKPAAAAAQYAKTLRVASRDVRAAASTIGVWPCADLVVAAIGLVAIDTVRPTAKALPATGARGGEVTLRYTVADASGSVRTTIVVYNGKKPVAGPTTSRFSPVVKGAARTTAWVAPAAPKGTYRFCVVAQDRAGNKSKQTCAPITVR